MLKRTLSIYAIAGFALLTTLCLVPARASSFVFMKVGRKVWLASDTLVTHTDQTTRSKRSGCKVAISSGRLVASVGSWTSLGTLIVREAVTPKGTLDEDADRMVEISKSMYMLGTDQAKLGIVRSNGDSFEAELVYLGSGGRRRNIRLDLRDGVPFGSGQAVDEATARALRDPAYASALSKDPKEKLLALLSDEAQRFPLFVGGPFTLLELQSNGEVSDISDNPACK